MKTILPYSTVPLLVTQVWEEKCLLSMVKLARAVQWFKLNKHWCKHKHSHPFSLSVSVCSLWYHIFSVSFIFSLGNKHDYYWYCLRGSSLWCHPDRSSEPRLPASCGGERLTSFTHQENTPSTQCSFSQSSSIGVTQTHHETEPEV